MKGDTSSGQEPVSTLNPVSILMFAHCFFQIKSNDGKLNMDNQLLEICSEVNLACVFVERGRGIFITTFSSPLSPEQQRNLEQVCAEGRVWKQCPLVPEP